MAGLQLVPIQDAIVARLKSVMPNTPIDEDGVLDDTILARTTAPGAQLVPYIVPRFGSIRRKPLGYAIAGTRYDDYYSTVDVACVAPVGRAARKMLDVATDCLIGWCPPDSTEITVEGLPDNFVIVNNIGRPAAFVATLRLRFGVNGSDVGSNIPTTP